MASCRTCKAAVGDGYALCPVCAAAAVKREYAELVARSVANLVMAGEVEERWRKAESQNANVAVCYQCGGPTMNSQSLVCKQCEGGQK